MKRTKIRKWISLGLTMSMLLSAVSGFAGCGKQPAELNSDNQSGLQEDETYLTRGEWIEGLARSFGIAECLTEEPYFSDVSKENELFPYVQAVGDLGAYEETGTAFEAEEYVTREFAVATAVIAADVLEGTGYVAAEDEGTVDYDTCIKFAFDNGNIEKTDEEFLAENITAGEAQLILEWATYAFEHPVINEKEEVVLQEGVVDFSEKTSGITVSGDTVTIDAALGSSLQTGDVFLAPATEEIPWAVAKKVVSVTTDAAGNQVVITEQPELIEVFSSIDIEQIAMPDLSYIVPAEGVTITESSDTVGMAEHMQLASTGSGMRRSCDGFTYDTDGDKVIDYNIDGEKFRHKDITFNVAIKKGGVVSIGKAYENSLIKTTAMLNDIGNEDVEKKIENVLRKTGAEFSGETLKDLKAKKGKMYDERALSMEGKITLSDLYASVDIDLDTILGAVVYDVNTLGLTINYVADADIKILGEYSGETLIGYIYFPIAGICALVLEVFTYVDGNGQIQLTIRTGTNASYRYEENKPEKFAVRDYSQPWTAEVLIDAETGAGVKPNVSIAGVHVLELGVKTGVNLGYTIDTVKETSKPEEMENGTKSVTESNYLHVAGAVTWPVVTVNGKIDLVVGETETELQLIGPEGIYESIVAWNFLEERFLLSEQEYIINADGSKVEGVSTAMLSELLNTPAKNGVYSISYDNFYKREGVEAFTDSLYVENKDNLEEQQQYRPGTNISYWEGDIDFGDGSVLSGGANLIFETQDEDFSYRNGTDILYDSQNLLKVNTSRIEVADNDFRVRGNVGGFMDFLTAHEAYHVSDFVQLLQLTQGFYDNMQKDSAFYQEKLKVGGYGEVTFTLSCTKDFSGYEWKYLTISFAEDSSSPYREIMITEGMVNTFTEFVPFISVSALTPAYYTTEDWPDRSF